jgi:deoxyribodipyrimidine photo-lyase
MNETSILWLRRDLRIDDNPALRAAIDGAQRVLPLYIDAPEEDSPWTLGAASRWWLHGSLASLARELERRGSRLALVRGPSLETLRSVARRVGATRIYWSRLYEPAARARDTEIKLALRNDGLVAESCNSALIREPWEALNGAGGPYRVFGAFWRRSLPGLRDIQPMAAPNSLPPAPDFPALALADLKLLPRIPWDSGLADRWTPGEPQALRRADEMVERRLESYGVERDLPAVAGTSSLSPHLHFGELSPRRLLAMIVDRYGSPGEKPAEPFVRELFWREFAYHLLYHYPKTPEEPLDPRFARFPWRDDSAAAEAFANWQTGKTGIPLIDAGMRELWHTGWMHNRVRMAVASLLTKNLLVPWQVGARWFWDTLVDADLAANTLGWQWTAGCGADAAPYFRVFNPVRQGERFDPNGAYVRRWCPELAKLPDKLVHQPWAAPPAVLRAAGVSLGASYPLPIVDLAESRLAALAAYDTVKSR